MTASINVGNARLSSLNTKVEADLAQSSQDTFIKVSLQAPFDIDIFVQAGLAQAASTQATSINPQPHRIIDLTECAGLDITTTQIFSMIAATKDWKHLTDSKIALVVATQEDAGLMRIFATSTGFKLIRVFLSVSEAERWIALAGKRLMDGMSASKYETVRFRDKFSLDDVLRKQIELSQSMAKVDGPMLWDLRDAILVESLNEVEQKAVYVAANHERLRPEGYTAVLTDSHLMELLLLEMRKADNWPKQHIQSFRSYKDALNWLAMKAQA